MKRIVVEGVSKNFRKGFDKKQGLFGRLLSGISYIEPKRRICVMKDVTITVNSGEFVGVIGKNGAGKSTMLRIMAGIYKPDQGKVRTRGNIVSIIGASGLKERLSVKDNIYLYCSLLGMSNSMIRKRFDSIVIYSNLEDMTSTKIFQLSEGMKQKLVFSVVLHCDPDIMIVDESFELGDERFKKKSVALLKDFVKKGRCVVLASHNLDMIRRHCERVVWLDNGMIVKDGSCKNVIKSYIARMKEENGSSQF